MKIKFLTVITSLLTAAFMITSCLDDNEVVPEYSSNASITAFSIENIETQYIDSTHYGKDTTLTATVIGKNYPFAIDQGRRLIYNVDSLPYGTDVKKVVVSITADTPWIVIATADKDTVWTSTDSLNFENPIKFKVVAYSGAYGPTYTATLNVHKQIPDSLQWTQIGAGFNKEITAQKAVTLDDKIYVFGQQGTETVLTTTAINDGRTWTEPTANLPANADYSSAMVWGDKLYILAGKKLHSSTNGSEWKEVETDVQFRQLIANAYSDKVKKLYAINADNHFIESEDGVTWKENEEVPTNFPRTHLSYAASPLETNKAIERMTIMGDNGIPTDTAAIVWTKLTTENTWADYPINEKETRYCPKLENIAMIYYNDQLYAFGGPGKSYDKEIPAFSKFYESKDQGITWFPVKRDAGFPDTFTALYKKAEGNYSFVVDKENFLWIIWSESGEVWRGRINKLGFKKN